MDRNAVVNVVCSSGLHPQLFSINMFSDSFCDVALVLLFRVMFYRDCERSFAFNDYAKFQFCVRILSV